MSSTVKRHAGFLVFAALALVAAGLVWFVMPHDREVKALWIFLVKLVPFVLALEAIARLDADWARRWKLHLAAIPATFLVYFCFFVPKIFFYAEDYPKLYYHVLTLTPMIILSLVLAYRFAGGRPSIVRRLGYGMLLLMLSGLEDLAYLKVNHHTDPMWATIPDKWTWASHMTVELGGHVPTKYQAYAFIAVHVLLALAVLFVPGRWFRRTRSAGGAADQARPAGGAAETISSDAHVEATNGGGAPADGAEATR